MNNVSRHCASCLHCTAAARMRGGIRRAVAAGGSHLRISRANITPRNNLKKMKAIMAQRV